MATAEAHPETDAHHSSTGVDNVKMGMWAFLGSECLFFGSFISTYLLYRNRVLDGPTPHEIYDIPYTSVSSFVLPVKISAVLCRPISAMSQCFHDVPHIFPTTRERNERGVSGHKLLCRTI